jgi:branched-chain amino acid aminotransferase
MKECVQRHYSKDGKILGCGSFHVGLINEGKSIYEVARQVGSRLLFLEDHIDRLFRSMELEELQSWLGRKEIREQLDQLIRKVSVEEGNVKFVMNYRSPAERHFIAYFVAHRYPSAEDYKNGVKVITYPFERPDPNKKLWRPDFREKVARAIHTGKAFEALLTDSEGSVPEASKANVFAIRDNTIITPPDNLILPGITRKYVLRICSETGIPVVMRRILLEELKDLEGLFLTGTSLHVLPVRQVDNTGLPPGNPLVRKIMDQFENRIQNYLRET